MKGCDFMNCEQIKELFSPFIDNRLTDAQKVRLLTHTDRCEECKRELAALEELAGEVNALGQVELPEGYHAQLMEKLSKKTGKPRAKLAFSVDKSAPRRFGSIAATVLITLCLFAAGNVLFSYLNDQDKYGQTSGEYGAAADVAGNSAPKPNAAPSTNDGGAAKEASTATGLSGADFDGVMEEAQIDADASRAVAEQPENEIPAGSLETADMAMLTGAGMAAKEAEAKTAADTLPAPAAAFAPNRLTASEKIVKNVTVEIYVEDLFEAVNAINALSGYNTSSDVNYYSPDVTKKYGYASLTRRVGTNELEFVRAIVRELGRLESENESQSDLTGEYNDLAIRAANARNEITRLSTLIGKSENLNNIIYVENRIADIDWRLDSHLGRMREIDAQASQPYLYIYITAEEPFIPIITEETFLSRMQDAFSASVTFTRNFIEGFTIFIAQAVVPLSVFGIIAIIVILIVRKAKGVKK